MDNGNGFAQPFWFPVIDTVKHFHGSSIDFLFAGFYLGGAGARITMTATYGSTLGIRSPGMILALMMTRILAFPFSILFGRIS
jgi:UMF1 family MFS transporter